MSTARVRRVLSLASALDVDERAEVAAEIIAGLAPGGDVSPKEWERTWRKEISRRLADRRPGVPWAKVRARVQRALANVRAQRYR